MATPASKLREYYDQKHSADPSLQWKTKLKEMEIVRNRETELSHISRENDRLHSPMTYTSPTKMGLSLTRNSPGRPRDFRGLGSPMSSISLSSPQASSFDSSHYSRRSPSFPRTSEPEFIVREKLATTIADREQLSQRFANERNELNKTIRSLEAEVQRLSKDLTKVLNANRSSGPTDPSEVGRLNEIVKSLMDENERLRQSMKLDIDHQREAARVSNVNEALVMLKKELDASEEKNVELAREVSKLKGDLATSEDDGAVTKLRIERDFLQKEVDEYRLKQSALEQREKELEGKESEADRIRKAIVEKEAMSALLKEKEEESFRKIDMYKKETEELRQKIKDLETREAQTVSDQSRKESVTETAKGEDEGNKKVQSKALEEAVQAKEKLEAQLKEAEEDRERLMKGLDALKKQNDEYSEKLKSPEGDQSRALEDTRRALARAQCDTLIAEDDKVGWRKKASQIADQRDLAVRCYLDALLLARRDRDLSEDDLQVLVNDLAKKADDLANAEKSYNLTTEDHLAMKDMQALHTAVDMIKRIPEQLSVAQAMGVVASLDREKTLHRGEIEDCMRRERNLVELLELREHEIRALVSKLHLMESDVERVKNDKLNTIMCAQSDKYFMCKALNEAELEVGQLRRTNHKSLISNKTLEMQLEKEKMSLRMAAAKATGNIANTSSSTFASPPHVSPLNMTTNSIPVGQASAIFHSLESVRTKSPIRQSDGTVYEEVGNQ